MRGNDYEDDFDEGPSEEDLARFDHETMECPACGEEVWDGASVCPKCGEAMDEGAQHARNPKMQMQQRITVVIVVLVIIGLVFWWLL